MSAGVETVEQILVIPTALFHEIGHFQGFSANSAPYLQALADPRNTSYRPRPEMELDPSFKQLIPYCIFRCDGKIFCYTRGKGQGEGRLHAKRSIGVGGHISSVDAGAGSPYLEAMRREIEEEVDLSAKYQQQLVGLINDDITEVGKVHLGIVHIFDLDTPQVLPRETSMIDAGFVTPAELRENRDRLETWSQICLDHLFPAD